MKLYPLAALAVLLAIVPARGAESRASFIYETLEEFFSRGDFDGDGRMDLIIVDKNSGKFRLGYQTTNGVLSWVDCRISGIKGVSGFSIGKLFGTNVDSLAFTSPDANQISLVNASSSTAPSRPLVVPFSAAVGPQTLVAVDIGGGGNTAVADLYVGSIYNSPEANLATLLRNVGTEFPKLAEAPLPGPLGRGNRLSFKAGQPEMACVIVSGEKGDTFRAENLSSGKAVDAAVAGDLASGSDYTVGNFRGAPLPELIFYKPGENKLTMRPVKETSPGQFTFGKGSTFNPGGPLRRVITLEEKPRPRLFVIFGEGEKAGIFSFDGSQAPALAQTIVSTNELLTCAETITDGFIA